jgi:hypothetical protein
MAFKRLFIWVEGDDDMRFFDRIIKPRFGSQYNCVEIIRYANMPKKKFNQFMDSIIAMKADYLYIKDINACPCITTKKLKIKEQIDCIDANRIIITIKEIESWYLSGISDYYMQKFRLRYGQCTDNITKEQCLKIIPRRFNSKLDFMLEILKYFSIDIAKTRNRSFRYFVEKWDL